MTRKNYTAENVSASGPYSHAVDARDFIYLSGQTARNGKDTDPNKELGSIEEQTKTAFSYLTSVLEAAGATSDEVVKVNVYLTSMDYFDEMNEVYKSYFNAPYPARTCVAVKELPLKTDVEIEFVVKKSKA